jgi:TfoX/Sxy family transcriptional regulator of competence genes
MKEKSMSSSIEYIEYVLQQLKDLNLSYKKMFGDYMIYYLGKPVLLICDNTTYVKINDKTSIYLSNNDIGVPYTGAKPHYILDVDDVDLVRKIIIELETITPLPKVKRKRGEI